MSESRLDDIETRWSLLRLAHSDSADTAQARRVLVLRYSAAVRRYVGAMMRNRDDADEMAQEVVVRLMRGDFAGADPSRGRFRDFLKTAVRNMVHNHWAKQSRRQTEVLAVEPASQADQDAREQVWLGAWQKTVLDHALSACRENEAGKGGTSTSVLLKLRTDFPDATSNELAEKLGAMTGSSVKPDAFRQMLRRARLKFAQCLIREIENGLDEQSPQRVLDELAALGLLEHVRDLLPEDYSQSGKLVET
jgi:RNA polymerase sigma-70 factor (ECF subfamily)